jgi:DNA repair ATPase RecN
MKKRIMAVTLLALLTAAATSWAISSEPVYIKTPDQLQAFKGRLNALQKLLKANRERFDGQSSLESLISAEVARLTAIKTDDAMPKIEVTKLYRSLDAEGKKLALKDRAAGAAVLEQIAECIDFVSSSNDHAPRWKWAPIP